AVEKESEIVRTGASFRMALEPERGLVGKLDSLKAGIEQRHGGEAPRAGRGGRVDGEAVILAGDQHLSGVLVEHRMVGAMMAELHLDRFRPAREAEQLMTEADTERRHPRGKEFADRFDRIAARLGIAGSVRQ